MKLLREDPWLVVGVLLVLGLILLAGGEGNFR